MKVYIGSDHGGFWLKEQIKNHLDKNKIEVIDIGCNSEESVDYPYYANILCDNVKKDTGSKGILVCGTGIGMSIAANKHEGIRAALVSDVFSAKATRDHNNTNVLCLGQRVIGDSLAKLIVDTWLNTEFSKKPKHVRRIEMFVRE